MVSLTCPHCQKTADYSFNEAIKETPGVEETHEFITKCGNCLNLFKVTIITDGNVEEEE